MNPERWAQIEDIFHRVSERDEAHRCALLDQSCNGDAELRREIEALLASEANAGACLESAIHAGLDSLVYPLAGETISHFVILNGLDVGGMGVVYRARDVRLGRTVAIKFLPEDSTIDALARGRFEREAKAASALEHPNICPIYEFGEHAGQLFLVMPLLEGQTVRELIAVDYEGKKPPHFDELLNFAIQILTGLEVAHRQGLIHRDIKPGNLFMTRHGENKILDFGLAKLTGANDEANQPQTLTCEPGVLAFDNSLSRTGNAIGTAAYMSPEQMSGQDLDARTDIYSFGIVLFELITGRRPARDLEPRKLEEEIRDHALPTTRQWSKNVRSILAEVLGRALAPERDRRYQSAAEMCRDLEKLKAVAANSSLRRRRLAIVVAGVLLGAGVMFFEVSGSRRTAAIVPEFRLRQLTSNSVENHVLNGAVSPDGNYLAYTDVKGLHLKRLDTGETRAVVLSGQTLDTYNNSPAWFPDSLSFLVNTHESSTAFLGQTPSDATIWRVFVRGDPPRSIRENAFAWGVSPVDSQIAFGTHHGSRGPREVWLMEPDGGNARLLYATDEAHQIGPFSWSPDGQHLGFVRGGEDGDIGFSIDLKGNPPIPNATDEEMNSRPGSLLLPRNKVIYSLFEQGEENTCNFWIGDFDEQTLKTTGNMHRLTNWTGFCMDPTSATHDGRKIAFLKWTSSRTIYLADLNAAGNRVAALRHFTLDETATSLVGWMPDGKTLLLWSGLDGNSAFFRQGVNDDTAQLIATVPGAMQDPVLTGDGKWVLASVSPVGAKVAHDRRLMRFSVQGGNYEWLGPMEQGAHLSCAQGIQGFCILAEPTPDRLRMVLSFFDPIHGKGSEITRMDMNKDGVWDFDISPDGNRFAFICGAAMPIGIFTLRNRHISSISSPLTLKQSVRWDRQGRNLYVTSGVKGGFELFSADMSGAIQKFWHNDGDIPPLGLASLDGRHLAIQDSRLDVNMWLLEMSDKNRE